jgi:hypothetical protein
VKSSALSVGEGAAFPGKLAASPTRIFAICVHLWLKFFRSLLFCIVSLFLFASCANRHFEIVAEGPPRNAPRYIDLLAGAQVATLHFPPGAYSFYAVDDFGWYYRAPRQIVERTGGASVFHNGGLYLSRKTPKSLRAYVSMPGGITHVGNLTRAHYEFRD